MSAPEPGHPERKPARPPGGAYGQGLREASPYVGLGLQIAATMGVFVGGGIALDRALGTSPWLMLLGTALAFAGVIALIVRLATVPPAGAPPPKRGTAPKPGAPNSRPHL